MTDIKTAFEYARESVSAEDCAHRYGIAVNRSHRARCPFHGGEHFNLGFKSQGFRCFVCGVSGDSVEFTRLVFDYEKPITALKRLNEDFGLGLSIHNSEFIIHNSELKPLLKKTSEKAKQREITQKAHRILSEYERSLRRIRREFISKDLWVHSLHNLDYAEYLTDYFESLPREKQLEFIKNERNLINEYEKFNGIIGRYGE